MAIAEPEPEGVAALHAAIESMGERVRAAAADIDRDRHVPDGIVTELREAGFFRMLVPVAYGGWETPAPHVVELIAALARYDASTAWVLMIGATTHALTAFLPEAGAREIYRNGADFPMGGLITPPPGRAGPVEGGYRVSGRWPFGSAARHCDWFVARCQVDGDEPGNPPLIVFMPASDVTIHDTWRVVGMRGTGSHDYQTDGTFVPASRAFRADDEPAAQQGPLYRLARFGLLPAYMGAISIGIGRAAIDAFTAYARAKVVNGTPLTELPLTRARVAEAEAIVGSARAYLLQVARDSWAKVSAGEDLSAADSALQVLSATHAAHTCAGAVDLMFTSGGAAALSTAGALQRHLRDVHAAKQHRLVGFGMYEQAGRMLLTTG